MNKAVRFVALTVAIPATVLLSAASCQSANDAPVVGGNEQGDQTPAAIIAMPDKFGNVAEKCDAHGNRVYTLYHGTDNYGSIFVVAADPTCKK